MAHQRGFDLLRLDLHSAGIDHMIGASGDDEPPSAVMNPVSPLRHQPSTKRWAVRCGSFQ